MDQLLFLGHLVVSPLALGLEAIAELTGLRWGPTPRHLFWHQSPSLHVLCFLGVAVMLCGALQQLSKTYRSRAVALIACQSAGRSMNSWTNRAVGYVLVACFVSQVWAKSIRPKPLIQLGWLLMPCHLITLVWAYILLRGRPTQYATNVYLATLLIDWTWAPLAAAVQPDWGDHQMALEGVIFVVHHSLLLVLPLYFAARYDTLPLSRAHVCHLTWVATFMNFGVYTVYALLSGLNLNYMLYPPPMAHRPFPLNTAYYRPLMVLVLVLLSVVCNVTIRGAGMLVAKAVKRSRRVAQKMK